MDFNNNSNWSMCDTVIIITKYEKYCLKEFKQKDKNVHIYTCLVALLGNIWSKPIVMQYKCMTMELTSLVAW